MTSTEEARSHLAAFRDKGPSTLGATEWRSIGQFEEDLFATLIGDFDPMHNETGWGKSVGLGGAVVLGVHVISLLPVLLREHGLPVRPEGNPTWSPTRLGRVRIPISLPVGARFRSHAELLEVTSEGDSFVVRTSHRVEIENEEKPFMVIDELISTFDFAE
jgi:acyl dehydratase